MSADVDLGEQTPPHGRQPGAIVGFVAVGWAVVGLCYARSPEPEATALVVVVAALVWWLAVVVIVRSDLADYVIPDEASTVVALVGLAQAVVKPLAAGAGSIEAALAGVSALGTGAGAFLLFAAVRWLARAIGGREALGFGDVKLAGASALWLAPGDAALALEIAALGAIAAYVAARRRGAVPDVALPFGAFMSPAAWLVYVTVPVVRDMLT